MCGSTVQTVGGEFVRFPFLREQLGTVGHRLRYGRQQLLSPVT